MERLVKTRKRLCIELTYSFRSIELWTETGRVSTTWTNGNEFIMDYGFATRCTRYMICTFISYLNCHFDQILCFNSVKECF